jgi:hypothetical protein
MEQTECSEKSTYEIRTPGNYPDENIQGCNFLFNVYRSVHRNNILVYKSEQDARVMCILLGFIFFFFFRWRYSPLWALACRTIPLHLSLSVTKSLHLLTPNTWRSLFTSSLYLFLGLPLRLVPSISRVKIFLRILSSYLLSRWPSQFILYPFSSNLYTRSKFCYYINFQFFYSIWSECLFNHFISSLFALIQGRIWRDIRNSWVSWPVTDFT